MENKQDKWYNHGWMLAVGGALLAPIGTFVFDLFKSLPFSTTINKIYLWLTINVYNNDRLMGFIIGILTFLFLMIIKKYLPYFSKSKVEENLRIDEKVSDEDMLTAIKMELEPKLLAYNADKFGTDIWKWEWIKNPLINKYEAKNITPICPNIKCDNAPLFVKYYVTDNIYYCKKCEGVFLTKQSESQILELVEKKFKPLT